MTDCNADKYHGQIPAAERELRARKLIRVDIERENGPGISAIVTNLSEQGMGGRTEGFIQPFELITIIKKGYGRISAEVRWTEGQNFGVLFSEPVDVNLFNFTNHNNQQHFVPQPSDGHVWKGFKTTSSTKRPGVTSRYSKN
jgi:hypothetical protein